MFRATWTVVEDNRKGNILKPACLLTNIYLMTDIHQVNYRPKD
jgi:hypothetical protein